VIVVVILFALIIALLAIPFDIKFKIQRREEFHSDVAVQWLFGIVRFNIPSQRTQKLEKKPHKIKKIKKTRKKAANVSAAKDLLWNARFRYRVFKFVKDLLHIIHIAGFYIRLRLGLDDPADTGRLWAWLGPLAVFLSSLSNSMVQLEPDFQTEIVYLDSSGRMRIVPLQVFFTVFAFLFSPVTVSALWTMYRSSRK
jgi:hypothetical protein